MAKIRNVKRKHPTCHFRRYPKKYNSVNCVKPNCRISNLFTFLNSAYKTVSGHISIFCTYYCQRYPDF